MLSPSTSCLAHRRVGEGGELLVLRRQRQHRPPTGDDEEHDAALVERPADVDRAGLHLRPHPRARGPLLLDRGHHPVACCRAWRRCGTAATAWWGCRSARRQVAEHLDAGDRQVGVVELVDDLQHAAALAEHGAQRLAARRARPSGTAPGACPPRCRRSSSTGRRRRRRGSRAAGRTSPRSRRPSPAGGRRRPSRTGAAPSGRRAARRSARGSPASGVDHAVERLAPAPVDALRRTPPSGISSIRRNMRREAVAVRRRTGARLSEQLPVTTVVMPCSIAGKAYGSKQQLGVVVRVRVDEARRDDLAGGVDHSRVASASGRPTDTMRSPWHADVAEVAGQARAVDDRSRRGGSGPAWRLLSRRSTVIVSRSISTVHGCPSRSSRWCTPAASSARAIACLGHAQLRAAAVRVDELHHDLGLAVVAGAEHRHWRSPGIGPRRHAGGGPR